MAENTLTGTISFDVSGLSRLCVRTEGAYNNIVRAANDIKAELEAIDANWEGVYKTQSRQDFLKAYDALNSMKENAAKVDAVLLSKKNAFAKVQYANTEGGE